MRIIADQPHPAIAKARMRRRITLAAFAAFLLVCLFSLLLVGLHAGRTLPRRNIASLAQADEGVWVFHVPTLARTIEEDPSLDEKTHALAARLLAIMPSLHLQGEATVFASGTDGSHNWVIHLTIRRSQRIFHRKIEEFLQEAAANKNLGGDFSYAVDGRDVWIYHDAKLQQAIATRAREAGDKLIDDTIMPSGASVLVYRGPAGLLPENLRAALVLGPAEASFPVEFHQATSALPAKLIVAGNAREVSPGDPRLLFPWNARHGS